MCHRHRVKQCPGVGVARRTHQILGRPDFDDTPQIHDGNALADMGDNTEIVRDEQDRKLLFCLDIGQKIDDLGPDRHIERRHRFVGNQHRRAQGKGPRNAKTLALAT